jgi:hypothetical protein
MQPTNKEKFEYKPFLQRRKQKARETAIKRCRRLKRRAQAMAYA